MLTPLNSTHHQATENTKNLMKSLEKGKAVEEAENKKIVELTGMLFELC
jgi:hypothetical protein